MGLLNEWSTVFKNEEFCHHNEFISLVWARATNFFFEAGSVTLREDDGLYTLSEIITFQMSHFLRFPKFLSSDYCTLLFPLRTKCFATYGRLKCVNAHWKSGFPRMNGIYFVVSSQVVSGINRMGSIKDP